jgi:hypothetical protein
MRICSFVCIDLIVSHYFEFHNKCHEKVVIQVLRAHKVLFRALVLRNCRSSNSCSQPRAQDAISQFYEATQPGQTIPFSNDPLKPTAWGQAMPVTRNGSPVRPSKCPENSLSISQINLPIDPPFWYMLQLLFNLCFCMTD